MKTAVANTDKMDFLVVSAAPSSCAIFSCRRRTARASRLSCPSIATGPGASPPAVLPPSDSATTRPASASGPGTAPTPGPSPEPIAAAAAAAEAPGCCIGCWLRRLWSDGAALGWGPLTVAPWVTAWPCCKTSRCARCLTAARRSTLRLTSGLEKLRVGKQNTKAASRTQLMEPIYVQPLSAQHEKTLGEWSPDANRHMTRLQFGRITTIQ